jgi:hypothetical protein
MTGPEHCAEAERLLEHTATMLDADVAPEERTRRAPRAPGRHRRQATAHAALADAAVQG